MTRQINKAGIDLIKSFEGLKLSPYLCSAKIPTIGYGTTFYEDGRKVSLQDSPITETRAEQLLAIHLNTFAAKVEKMVTVSMTDNQFAALCSFAYNCGPANLASSTLLKKMNKQDYAGAAGEFEKWNKAGGKVLAGLTRRRQAEKALFMHSPSQSSLLPAGPSVQDIEAKLASIEKDIL
jgi:lysozyme